MTFSHGNNEYVGLCSEFPSLSWLAPSQDEAGLGIEALVRDVVEEMKVRGESLPEPRGR